MYDYRLLAILSIPLYLDAMKGNNDSHPAACLQNKIIELFKGKLISKKDYNKAVKALAQLQLVFENVLKNLENDKPFKIYDSNIDI